MFERSEEQDILLKNLKRVVDEKVAPAAAETDRTGAFNWEIVSLFWDLGLLKIMLPSEYDGWPGNPTHTLCLSIEEIAKACASSALLLIIQAVGSYPLIFSGNEAQKKKYCPVISDERRLIGYLVTEPGAGSDVQAIQFLLADAATLIEASRGLMERAALAFDTGRKNTKLASMAKFFCSDAAMKITTDMVQVLGGYGYIRDYPIERMFRDAKLTQIFEGANQIQRMIIGREISKR